MRQLKQQLYYLVNSDNFENSYMTPEAYKELTLQMSSGDFGSHNAKAVPKNEIPQGAQVLELDDLIDEGPRFKNIKEFQSDEKLALVPRSVRLTEEQDEFIKEYNINLSKFIRAQLDDLIRYANKEDKGEAV